MARENHINPVWIVVAAYGLYICLSLAQALSPSMDTLVGVSLPMIFALWHGSVRYKWRGSIAFAVICFVISNIFENVGVITGFPFGDYYYSDQLGPKLWKVPLIIGPAYYGTGYMSWMLASVIVGEVRRGASRFITFAVPFIAAFIMVSWDVCFDPESATFDKQWIWPHGGGYFGVPLSNFLGWWLTVYVLFQTFAIYVRSKDPGEQRAGTLPKPYWWQPITFYGMLAVGYVLQFYFQHKTDPIKDAMIDPTGKHWNLLQDFRETGAIFAIYTMGFAVAVSTIRLLQKGRPEETR